VTSHPEFDGFPMFSPDGKQLVWASGRSSKDGDLNLFIADWKPERPKPGLNQPASNQRLAQSRRRKILVDVRFRFRANERRGHSR
jgi:Tol biopolymer transport system component